MAEFFDYDPTTGVTQYFEYEEDTGKAHIHYVQDVEAILEWAKKNRDDPSVWKHGVKESWALYAKIPAVVQIQLRQKGIDINNPDHTDRVFREINENYPYLRLTEKWEGRKQLQR